MNQETPQNPDLPVAWCATCGFEDANVAWSLAGTRFRCPNAQFGQPHIAVVIPPSMRCWLRLQLLMVRVTDTRRHPRAWLCGGSAGRYLVVLTAGAGVALAFASAASWCRWIGAVLGLLLILDVLIYHLRVGFVTQLPQVPLRSAVFGLAGFALVTAGFAALYLSLARNDFKPRSLEPASAVYFSVVTIATVGYGDIHPRHDAAFAQFLVMAEILVGLIYVAVVLATLVGWANAPPQLLTLEQLRKDGEG